MVNLFLHYDATQCDSILVFEMVFG